MSKLFCKLDYVGISLLTVGSFVPWIYYGFYCQYTPKVRQNGSWVGNLTGLPLKVVYLSIISVLGIACIAVTMMDKFSDPVGFLATVLFIIHDKICLIQMSHYFYCSCIDLCELFCLSALAFLDLCPLYISLSR